MTNGDIAGDVKSLIQRLIKNYQLKESIEAATALCANSAMKEEANKHARLSLEFLFGIIEVSKGQRRERDDRERRQRGTMDLSFDLYKSSLLVSPCPTSLHTVFPRGP